MEEVNSFLASLDGDTQSPAPPPESAQESAQEGAQEKPLLSQNQETHSHVDQTTIQQPLEPKETNKSSSKANELEVFSSIPFEVARITFLCRREKWMIMTMMPDTTSLTRDPNTKNGFIQADTYMFLGCQWISPLPNWRTDSEDLGTSRASFYHRIKTLVL